MLLYRYSVLSHLPSFLRSWKCCYFWYNICWKRVEYLNYCFFTTTQINNRICIILLNLIRSLILLVCIFFTIVNCHILWCFICYNNICYRPQFRIREPECVFRNALTTIELHICLFIFHVNVIATWCVIIRCNINRSIIIIKIFSCSLNVFYKLYIRDKWCVNNNISFRRVQYLQYANYTNFNI
jgi:hypothetical protein